MVYESTDVPVDIPDFGIEAVRSTIVVEDAGTVADINVALDLTCTDGYLWAVLVTPDGTLLPLLDSFYAGGIGLSATTLDDEAEIAITDGEAPFTGSYTPQTPLSSIDGESITGSWMLVILAEWGVAEGTLNSWSMDITTGGGPAPTVALDPPSPDTLWPPNGKAKSVTISGSVEDAGGGIGAVWLSVDDEYDLADVASIEVYPDADGEFSVSINLAAARDEDDMDGRCYTIYLHAENEGGSDEASTSVAVVVPHHPR